MPAWQPVAVVWAAKESLQDPLMSPKPFETGVQPLVDPLSKVPLTIRLAAETVDARGSARDR